MWKDWVIIVGFLLILLILADGIRRKRNERNGNIKVSRSLKKSLKQQAEYEDEPPAEAPSYTSELPNGGARVVGQRDPSARVPSIEKKPQAKSYLEKHQQPEPVAPPSSLRAQREPQQTSLNLGQSVPMLMESVDDNKASAVANNERIEPSFSASRDEDLNDDYDDRQDDDYEGEDYERDDHPYTRELDDGEDRNILAQDESDYEDERDLSPEENEGFEDDEYRHEEEYDEDDSEEDYEGDESQSSSTAQNNFAEKQPAEPEEVLIINVMAHKGEMFNGADLLDIVLQCGMRYGSMDIFHRHSDTKGEGALLFSMANMVKPGTFDLDAMDEFETPGVSLFMTLPINADSMQSFDLMADTARAIAETLDGELKDEQRSVMTRQTLEHCRERIRNFERMRLFRRPAPR
ncbi:cell division protein ZipA [Cellvibrio sp. UBA7671]|uniref:cell division protein ZipA n=1 Tax=Cellvibrio sp. UBA7671 TaxID=1946312 RepID=UPI002F35DA3B